ncbi:hypothetical protein V499_03713 [Pseudogymnoascus sp. VKM F-103]|uniref:Uncharacterized protein n=1 Tax=Pseudogymnoascus verrucosus TaxID=342668 RepID=A0A1B8GV45_9PEZI|nr:uncharacterized protein VE01_02161 [Pseudogymnoascus verrucosus]KFY76746.1 hypothetical protein V499_03713 [Pseudogymnoascus sp. VKM F-103]OBT99670.1 hypothetical protein VE01_02161 [Pseudogymnoascus verrucosus]
MSKYVRQQKSLPKHPKTPSSADSPFAPTPIPVAPRQRPGWSGPGYTKKGGKHIPRPPPAPKPVVIPPGDEHQALGQPDQQLLLDAIRKAFPRCEDYEALKVVLADVEEKVRSGDWKAAFGSAEAREAWVVKWGAERAVWFANLLVKVVETLDDDPLFAMLQGRREDEDENEDDDDDEEDKEEKNKEEKKEENDDEDEEEVLRVVSFGGGPAEVLALGAVVRHFRPDAHGKSKADLESEDSSDAGQIIDLNLTNTVNWTREVSTSHEALLSPPTLSKYASASAIANSSPFLAKSALELEMQKFSPLEASQEEVGELVGEEAALITLFYTVADLAATSVAKTVALLLKLTIAAPKGSLVVVFDRAEEEGKKGYPLRYLLDMAFLGKKPSGEDQEEGVKPAWKMLLADEARVVKACDGVRYALGLETAKAQVYVFRRL